MCFLFWSLFTIGVAPLAPDLRPLKTRNWNTGDLVVTADPTSTSVDNLTFACSFADSCANLIVYETEHEGDSYYVDPNVSFANVIKKLVLENGMTLGSENSRYFVTDHESSVFGRKMEPWSVKFFVFAKDVDAASGVCRLPSKSKGFSLMFVILFLLVILGVVGFFSVRFPRKCKFWLVEAIRI